MNPSDLSQRAKAVFMAALEKESPDLRNQYLDQACADDPELRREVLELLASLKQSDSFLENKPGGALEQTTIHPTSMMRVGETIGPYKLLEEIGEGGMGSVWVAQQDKPIKRKVAIKLIKAGMDSKAVLARFGAERQALAMMDHPNIARVLDGGMTEQGRPYFAMEFVKGVPLTEYCDQAKLSVKERLELFLPICNAVQHAHQKGIIHRDLKPSNILVCLYDGKPVPKVIDFGLAKAIHQSLTEQSLYTAQGMMLGTPLYMSPEQAEHNNLDIDTRTDVYSLGVILYELLTGSTPLEKAQFKQAAAAEMLRLIREVEPPKPSTRLSGSASLPSVAAQRSIDPKHLTRSITGDLDWVVMKALEKERSRRYETANGLGMDILRHLSGEAVVAAPPSSAYRFKKFIRRNRVMVTAGGAVAAALLIGMIGFAWQANIANTQRAIAQQNEQKANDEARRADASKKDEATARKRAEIISEFVITALKASDAQNSGVEGGAKGSGQDMTILAAMDNAIADINSGRFKDDPETEAGLLATIGVILRNNGKYDKAKPLLEQALAMRERLFKSDDPIVADSLGNLAALYRFQGQYTQAEPLFTRSLAIREKALGLDHPDVATSLHGLAELYLLQRKYAQAETLFGRSLAILEQARGPDHPEVAATLNELAILHTIQGQYAQAEPLLTRALAIREKAQGPDHPDVATSLDGLAGLYRRQGKYAQAEPLYTRAVAILEKSWGPDHPYLSNTLNNLANLYYNQSLYTQAESFYKQALAIHEKTLGPDHPNVLTTKNNLATVYRSQGKLDKSVPLFEEVLKARRAKLGPGNPDTLATMGDLGVNYKDAGRLAEAIPLLDVAYGASKQYPDLAFAGLPLLDAYAKSADPAQPGDAARVVALMQELLVAARAALPKDSPELAGQLATFSMTLLALKAWDEAEPMIREALTIRDAKEPDDWRTFNTRSMLGGALLGQKKFTEAEPLLLDGYQGMKQREATIPPQGKERISEALERLVQLYKSIDKPDEASKWQAELDARHAVNDATAESKENTETTESKATSNDNKAAPTTEHSDDSESFDSTSTQVQQSAAVDELVAKANEAWSAGRYPEAFETATKICHLEPDNFRYQMLLGDISFAASKIDESIAAYDEAIRIDPDVEPRLWQRGLALYYADRFADGVKQFETHQSVNSQDVENAVWHLLCAARVSDVEQARKKLIPITADPRVPMAEIYEMFAGRMTPEDVLKAARKTSESVPADGDGHKLQLYYAWLYIGLHHEMLGEKEAALESLKKAEEQNPLGKTNFMGQVARVHLELRTTKGETK